MSEDVGVCVCVSLEMIPLWWAWGHWDLDALAVMLAVCAWLASRGLVWESAPGWLQEGLAYRYALTLHGPRTHATAARPRARAPDARRDDPTRRAIRMQNESQPTRRKHAERASHLLPRPHLGRKHVRLLFRVEELSVSLRAIGFEGKIIIAFARSTQSRETAPMQLHERVAANGSLVRTASTPQDLVLITTMYQRKDGGFEKKEAKFTVFEERRDGREVRLGSVRFDLASYTTELNVKQPLDLQLANGKTTIACLLSASTMAHEHDGDSNDSDAISSDGGAATEDEDEALPRRPAAASGHSAAVDVSDTSPWAAAATAPHLRVGDRGHTEVAALREQLRAVQAERAQLAGEAATLKARAQALRKEQRELRRKQPARDDAILQLEAAIEVKNAERVAAEEALAVAFGGVVQELHEKAEAIAKERDRLLIQLEAGTHRGQKKTTR